MISNADTAVVQKCISMLLSARTGDAEASLNVLGSYADRLTLEESGPGPWM